MTLSRKVTILYLVFALYSLSALSCLYTRHDIHVTLDIRHIQETATDIEDVVAGKKDIEELETDEQGAMLGRPLLPLPFCTPVQAAEGELKARQLTPTLKEAIEARKARYAQVEKLKDSGQAGENNRGLLETPPGKSADGAARKLMQDENADRETIYREIARQNNATRPEDLEKIRQAWALTLAEDAKAGQWVQAPSDNQMYQRFLRGPAGKKLDSKPDPGQWVQLR